MRNLKSAALATLFALGTIGISGHLVSVSAEPAIAPVAKVYAHNTSPSGSGVMSIQEGLGNSNDRDVWNSVGGSHPVGACDLRCRTGFFGYK